MPMTRKTEYHATLELVLEAKLGILLTVYYSTRAYESSFEHHCSYSMEHKHNYELGDK